MGSALAIIGAITLTAVGAGGMYEWDRHPPLGWHAHILFWKPGFDLPPSLKMVSDANAARADGAVKATGQCQTALSDQRAALSRQSGLDSAALQASAGSLRATEAQVASLQRGSSALRQQKPQGVDVCARWTDADRLVLLMLRGSP